MLLIASAGFKPLGQHDTQFKIEWHLPTLYTSFTCDKRLKKKSSLESINHLYDCSNTAGPKYLSLFHQ
jgi:hypothetical protein